MGIDELYKKEFGIVAGVDEAGRGCLAGPVVAAAVVLEKEIEGINSFPLRRGKDFSMK